MWIEYALVLSIVILAVGARRAARRRALKDGAVTGDGFAAVVTRAGHVVYSARAVACSAVEVGSSYDTYSTAWWKGAPGAALYKTGIAHLHYRPAPLCVRLLLRTASHATARD